LKKIDILIPAYHAQDTIGRTLSSIAMQSIVKDLNVVICNDDGMDSYKDFVDHFASLMDIKEIYLPKNGGCGVARQYGIDHTNAPFYTCIDADDTFASTFALEMLLNYIETDAKYVMVSGGFAEQLDNGLHFKNHIEDMIWMHGKLYRRSFTEKYNVRFNLTRSNEDNGFNTTIRLISNDAEKIMFVPDIVYYWHFKHDSITRVNNYQYTYNQSFIGYVDIMIDAIQNARKAKPEDTRQADVWAVQTMAELYVYLEQTVHNDQRFIAQNFGLCVKYYENIFKPLEPHVPQRKMEKIFAEVIYKHAKENADFCYTATIRQFLEQMEGATK
jgi:glycosyltransferase involved in cell wall biosynthesis